MFGQITRQKEGAKVKPYATRKAEAVKPAVAKKDIWDKITTLTPSFVTLILGLFGAYVTYSFNERSLEQKKTQDDRSRDLQIMLSDRDARQREQQAHETQTLAETQQLEKLFTYVSSKDAQSREFGYAMFAALGKEKLALRLINFNSDKAGIRLAIKLKSSSNPDIRAAAAQSLMSLSSMSNKLNIRQSTYVPTSVQTDLSRRLGYFVSYLAKIGFPPPSEKIDVRFLEYYEINSYYSPQDNAIYIGPRIVSDPHAALQQYAQYKLVVSRSLKDCTGDDAYGLCIGISDYLTSSYLDNPKIGSVVAKIYQFDRPYLRILENQISYHEVENGKRREPHEIFEVWGGAFWAIRQAVGRDKFDPILVSTWKTFNSSQKQGIPKSFLSHLLEQTDAKLSAEQATRVRTEFDVRGFLFSNSLAARQ